MIENLPELVEANIYIVDVCDIKNDNIFVSLTSVKRLSLDLPHSAIKYPTGIIFHQMVSLELSILREWDEENALERWGLLPLMLDTSPKLQILKLTDTSVEQKSFSCGLGMEPAKMCT
uniref:Putative F-box/FBD/LRR-repeat protein n=1 Tax=Noccaea caerulescens TaxID=107243 RepID=A0A1J3JBM0_NOCCA